MEIFDGYLTAPKGFKTAGAFVGIKKAKKDLCLIASDVPAAAAGCFTQNIVKAAPVLWDMDIIKSGGAVKGVVVNSGNANACTGLRGIEDNKTMAAVFADAINAETEEILVCSTGVIGVNLPMDAVCKGIETVAAQLDYSPEAGQNAAEAIMTTDTFMKTAAVRTVIGGKTVTLAGMAKGSGMIHPNMATLLAFVTTDCAISREMLRRALSGSVEKTYNMISVDGDTSTNDTILVLANGMAGNDVIDDESEAYAAFREALDYVNRTLAIAIARDGEGASKLLEVTVKGAKTDADAARLSKSVVSSSLVKAMMFGEDANGGRIMCAMGYSGGSFDPCNVDIDMRSLKGAFNFMKNGEPVVFDEAYAKTVLGEKEIFVDVALFEGTGAATAWGCDLTYEYVKINGDYRS